MSVENVKEYARRCATDPELRARAKELGMADMEEHMRQSESLGLDWTRGDLVAFRKEMIDAEGGLEDLSEEELADIAGGGVTTTAAVVVGVVAGVAAAGTVTAVGTTAAVGAGAAAGDGGW